MQRVFASGQPVDASLLAHIRSAVVPALRLGLAEGLDNEKTVTGSLTFMTGELCFVCGVVLFGVVVWDIFRSVWLAVDITNKT